MTKLIKAELLKIRTTNTWWIFLIGVFLFTGAALTIWLLSANFAIDTAATSANEAFVPPAPEDEVPPGVVDEMRRQWEIDHDIERTLVTNAANIFTSGQFFGLMFALMIGTLMMTNEFYHQTATATFLTTPARTRVIAAKLATGMLGAGFFWVFTTVLSLAVGLIFFAAKGYDAQLGDWPVQRAILLNGLAFMLWGVLGVGLGVLIRSQIGAVITGAVAYVVGTFLVSGITSTLAVVFGWNWLNDASVAWPGVASQLMISPEPPFVGAPAWWVGALVLVGYGVAFGTVGTLITRQRDIS